MFGPSLSLATESYYILCWLLPPQSHLSMRVTK